MHVVSKRQKQKRLALSLVLISLTTVLHLAQKFVPKKYFLPPIILICFIFRASVFKYPNAGILKVKFYFVVNLC